MINVTIVNNQVTGGMAVVAILVISGLGFGLWRAALAAYRGIVATTKTGNKKNQKIFRLMMFKKIKTAKTTLLTQLEI